MKNNYALREGQQSFSSFKLLFCHQFLQITWQIFIDAFLLPKRNNELILSHVFRFVTSKLLASFHVSTAPSFSKTRSLISGKGKISLFPSKRPSSLPISGYRRACLQGRARKNRQTYSWSLAFIQCRG